MTTISGKRKRRRSSEAVAHSEAAGENANANHHLRQLLRQHFETQFEPLTSANAEPELECLDAGVVQGDLTDTDWIGLSDDGEDADALVVEYKNLGEPSTDGSREELKLFMTTKPPLHSTALSSVVKPTSLDAADPTEAATDAANLKKDLALQRLLEESHLLDSTSSLAPQGRNRHKALDIRQQALGSKSSTYRQKNMPLAQRKGITAKVAGREEARRREAKENGIILEKATKSRSRNPKRQREIGAPTIGKYSRGMLTLTKRDVAGIVGQPKKGKRR